MRFWLKDSNNPYFMRFKQEKRLLINFKFATFGFQFGALQVKKECAIVSAERKKEARVHRIYFNISCIVGGSILRQ